jgi:hypothetical protein
LRIYRMIGYVRNVVLERTCLNRWTNRLVLIMFCINKNLFFSRNQVNYKIGGISYGIHTRQQQVFQYEI